MEFVYRLKRLTKQKEFIFWTLIFPLLLGTLFKLAFSKLNSLNILSEVAVAVVDNQYFENDLYLIDTLEAITLNETSEDKMFKVSKISEDTEAEYRAKLKELDAIILVTESNYKLYISGNGMNQEIIKNILDTILQTSDYLKTVGEKDPAKITQALAYMNEEINSYNYQILGKNPIDNMIIYFYTLIAMTAIYACFWGNKEIDDISVELSIGKRVFASSNNRVKTLCINLSCVYLVNLVGNLFVLLFLKFLLQINIDLLASFLMCLIGGFVGLMIGAFFSLHIKGSPAKKQGFTTSIVMFFTFCSGMMGNEIKYLLDKNVPFINYINPVNLITESLYQVFYYGYNTKFFLCMTGLLIIGIILMIFNFLKVRRIKI